MADRWSTYGGPTPTVAPGWTLDLVAGPSRLWGANGIVWGPGNELMVTQVFGSQVTAIDVDSGEHRPFAALGEGISAPDDGAFGYEGSFFATEPMNATVSVRRPDGSYQRLRDDLAGVNGMTMDHARRRLFVDEFRPGGRLLELDPTGENEPVVLLDDLAMPNAFAMGPDGALWFPQVIAGEIWRYDLDDRTARKVYDDLATPTAVKFDSQGRLVTSEAAVGHLTRIDLTTGAREVLAQVNPGIDNLAIGDGDRFFVSHFTDGRVAEVTGGVERVLSPSGLVGPFGLARRASGTIVAGDGLSVAEIGPGGELSRVMSLIADLPSMAIDAGELDGDVLALVERGQVFRKPAGGRATPIAGRLQGPTAMCDSRDGGVLVVERAAGRVVRVDAGGVTGELASGLTRPHSASVAEDGTLWVSDDGRAVAVRGGEVVAHLEGPAAASGIAAGNGMVVLADPAHRTIVVHDLAAQTATTVVTDAPIGVPVAAGHLPHTATPVVADGDGFLVGCDGDGSVRRLRRA